MNGLAKIITSYFCRMAFSYLLSINVRKLDLLWNNTCIEDVHWLPSINFLALGSKGWKVMSLIKDNLVHHFVDKQMSRQMCKRCFPHWRIMKSLFFPRYGLPSFDFGSINTEKPKSCSIVASHLHGTSSCKLLHHKTHAHIEYLVANYVLILGDVQKMI